MTLYQIITTTRAGIEYGPEFAVEDAIANLIDHNLDYFSESSEAFLGEPLYP